MASEETPRPARSTTHRTDTTAAAADTTADTTTGPGPWLSKIGLIALVALLVSGLAIAVGLTQPWMTWTPETGEDAGVEQEAGFYELDSPAFLRAIGDNDFYLQEGAFSAMLALAIGALFAFGLLAYESTDPAGRPATLRTVLAGTLLVLTGVGALAASNRFIAEASAMSNNFQVQASSLAGVYVSISAAAVLLLGLGALYLAADHRLARPARYDADTQRILTAALVGLVLLAGVAYASVSLAPWTELRGEVEVVQQFPGLPGTGAFAFRDAGTFQITEHVLADASQPKPLFEMKKDVQLVSAAAFAGLLVGLGGLYGLTHLRNRGDNEGAQVLMLVGGATVVAAVGILFGILNFVGHADELSTFLRTEFAGGNGQVTTDVATAGLTNYLPLFVGLIALVVGGYYVLKVLPVAGRVVSTAPSPAAGAYGAGTGPGGADAAAIETTDGETVVVTADDVPQGTLVETRIIEGGGPAGTTAARAAPAATAASPEATPAETLAQLDRRLIAGEISEEAYWDIRTRL